MFNLNLLKTTLCSFFITLIIMLQEQLTIKSLLRYLDQIKKNKEEEVSCNRSTLLALYLINNLGIKDLLQVKLLINKQKLLHQFTNRNKLIIKRLMISIFRMKLRKLRM